MSEFDEWYEENSWDLENYYDAEKSFKAGQQSRQSEVDDLIDMVKTSADSEMYLFDVLQKVEKDRDELQKQIDEALKILQEMKHNGAYRATYILKGKNND